MAVWKMPPCRLDQQGRSQAEEPGWGAVRAGTEAVAVGWRQGVPSSGRTYGLGERYGTEVRAGAISWSLSEMQQLAAGGAEQFCLCCGSDA